ncbi:MAG: hypothetical protein K6B54_04875 [Clostridia bacterium]|nr:hypothetical protein [Clostridia bacterium]
MIILIITLISLCAIYFIRLLSKKNMRVASISVATLYINIIVWTYAIFVLDVANLGFSDSETPITSLIGSDIYHSFVNITNKMAFIPLGLLKAIVVVITVIFVASLAVTFHGLFEITRAVIKAAKERPITIQSGNSKDKLYCYNGFIKRIRIFRLNCRMNC